MALEPWYKVVTLRREVREGRSFSPDEFAIALEHVVAGTAPEDYRDPAQFFARTCFTRALKDHTGMVLRRLSGRTENTSPVLTLITQFGRRQDAYAHLALSPCASRRGCLSIPGRGGSPERGRDNQSSRRSRRRLRRQRLGPSRRQGNAVDRRRPATRR